MRLGRRGKKGRGGRQNLVELLNCGDNCIIEQRGTCFLSGQGVRDDVMPVFSSGWRDQGAFLDRGCLMEGSTGVIGGNAVYIPIGGVRGAGKKNNMHAFCTIGVGIKRSCL
jgi:hypothetical protein